jgi:deoxyadenosine/deoxycytidine kinase
MNSTESHEISSPSLRKPTKFIINTMEDISFYATIQGVIGAGKSTLIKAIERYIDVNGLSFLDHYEDDKLKGTIKKDYFIIIHEPLSEWIKPIYSTKKVGEKEEEKLVSLLDLFYKDKSKYGFDFQINAFTTRLEKIVNTLNGIKHTFDSSIVRLHIIAERSMKTDYLFFKNLYDNGQIPHYQWNIYNRFFNLICGEIIKKENVMIFVKTSAEKCLMRVKERERQAEMINQEEEEEEDGLTKKKIDKGVTLEYLRLLEQKHQELIDNQKEKNLGLGPDDQHVIIIETDFDKDMNKITIDKIASSIMKTLMFHIGVKLGQ